MDVNDFDGGPEGPPIWLRRLAAATHPVLNVGSRFYRLGLKERCRRRFKQVGWGISFDPTTSLISYETVTVGNNTHLGPYAYINGMVDIGSDVMLAPIVHIMDGYHRTDIVGLGIRASGGDDRARVVIEDDVWIGARSSVMKGVRLGEGSVVGTGSVVLREVPPYTIAVGSPAKPVKLRFTDTELREHLRLIGRDQASAEAMIFRRRQVLRDLGFESLFGAESSPMPARSNAR